MNKAEVENKGLDQDFFDYLCNEYVALHPMLATMEIKTIYLGKGIASMRLCPLPQYSSAGGRVHGGIIATLADCVMGRAMVTATGRLCRTLDFNLNFVAGIFENNELIAEGNVIHAGKTVGLVEGTLFNNEGKLIAKSRASFIIDNRYPPIWGK